MYSNYYQVASYLLLFDVIAVFLAKNFLFDNEIPLALGYSFWFFLGVFLSLSLLRYLEKKIGIERYVK